MAHPMLALIVIVGGIAAFVLLVAMIAAGVRHRRTGDGHADGSGDGTAAWMFMDNSTHHGGGHNGSHDGGGHSGGSDGGGGGHGGH